MLGAAPDLSEPPVFKNVSLQMVIDQKHSFFPIFKKIAPHATFDVQYEWSQRKQYPVTASTKICHFCFHIPALNNDRFFCLTLSISVYNY